LKSVRLITPARQLGPYQLTASDGSALGGRELQGHWTVVFLGFTHCPDVCPTTLAELALAQKTWETIPEARRPRVLFVSVDPERDTPKLTGEYARFFHPDTLAATADAEPLARFAETMGLVYMKVPLDQGGYSMDHSATLVVLDPQGRQAGLIRPPLVWKDVAADLRLLAGAAQ
jgi:protein SCO1/2